MRRRVERKPSSEGGNDPIRSKNVCMLPSAVDVLVIEEH